MVTAWAVRGAFVVTQVSMAVLLMAGCGVLLRSFVNLRAVDPGFSADNVLTLQLSLSLAGMGLMNSLLFEVTATDSLTLAVVALGLALVAAIAGTLPARRATRVDAVIALQGD